MSIETIITCPLGSKCEDIKDNKLHRCAWYQCLQGQHPTTGEHIDEWKCALVWQNILAVENSMVTRSMTAATESLRNEMVNGQQAFNNIMLTANNLKGITNG